MPEPDEAKEYLPGLALHNAVSSGTDFTGRSRRTISMLGTDHIMATAVKSLSTSNGSLA